MTAVAPMWPTSTPSCRERRAFASRATPEATVCTSLIQQTLTHGWKAKPSIWERWNEQVGAELRRLDQNIEGLINKFQRQSQMIARTDNHEEHLETLFTELADLRDRVEALESSR